MSDLYYLTPEQLSLALFSAVTWSASGGWFAGYQWHYPCFKTEPTMARCAQGIWA